MKAPHILVVDDDPGLLGLVARLLTGAGYLVTVVGCGEDACA
jgi:CheY-like chemotaxis protein